LHPRHRSGPRQALAAVALLLALAAANRALAQNELPSELESVEKVRMKGRHHVSGHELRVVMKTRAASILPWRERPLLRLDFVRADTLAIASVYRQHGFLDARVGYDVKLGKDRTRATVTFDIDEGRRSFIKAVEFTGLGGYPEDQLRKRLYARPGRAFNPSFLLADTARISEAYQERGYRPHVGAFSRRESLDVIVHYEVVEGISYRFGEVLFSSPGELHVQRKLIDREIVIHPGDLYRRSKITSSLERLYETGLFSEVQISPLPIDSTIEIDLRVRERKMRWVDAGIGSGTVERFSVRGEWGHRNVGGQGLQGTLDSRLSFDDQARFLLTRTEASLLEPWLLGSRTRGQFTVYYDKHNDYVTDSRWVVKQQAPGVTFQLRRDFGRYVRLALTQDNAFVTQTIHITVPDSTLPAAVQDSLFASAPHSYTTHRLSLTLDRDRRDVPINPMRGSLQNLTIEIAGGPLTGSSSYAKAQIGSAWYSPIGTSVLAGRVRTGLIGPFGRANQFTPEGTEVTDSQVERVPLENRFRLGGVNSIRGFGENTVPPTGGLAMFLANLELRVPLVGPFGMELFADAGNVWARPSYIKATDFVLRTTRSLPSPGSVRYVFGAGLRLNLPFGPLRLDATLLPPPEKPNRFPATLQFAIGPAF